MSQGCFALALDYAGLLERLLASPSPPSLCLRGAQLWRWILASWRDYRPAPALPSPSALAASLAQARVATAASLLHRLDISTRGSLASTLSGMDKDRRAARAAVLNMQRRQMVEECRGQLQQLGECRGQLQRERQQMVEESRAELLKHHKHQHQQRQQGERGAPCCDSLQGEEVAGGELLDDSLQREVAGDPRTSIGDAEGDLVAEFEARWQVAMMMVQSTVMQRGT